MNCEICGKEIKKGNKIIVESTILTVCDSCKKLGKPVDTAKLAEMPFIPPEMIQKRLKKPGFKDDLELSEILVENYGELIKNTRLAKNISLDDLAKNILEKKMLLSKIERQELKPDDKLIKKLEKALGIKLKEKVGYMKSEAKHDTGALTLGDLIKKSKKS